MPHSSSATGLVDWDDPGSSALLPGVASRPIPTLAMEGTRGVISGIRFLHTIRCGDCRSSGYLYSDGGTIEAGLEVLRGGATVRWFLVEHPGCQRPQLPEACFNPRCEHGDRPWTSLGGGSVHPVAAEPMELLNIVWCTVRETVPDLAARADKATTRYEPAASHR